MHIYINMPILFDRQKTPLASFVLLSSQADIKRELNCDIYYYNFDLRDILGDLFIQYEDFYMNVSYIAKGNNNSGDFVGIPQDDTNNSYVLYGLDFETNTYDCGTKKLLNEGHIGVNNVSAGFSQFKSLNGFRFHKQFSKCTLNIKIKRLDDAYQTSTLNLYDRTMFILQIYPLV